MIKQRFVSTATASTGYIRKLRILAGVLYGHKQQFWSIIRISINIVSAKKRHTAEKQTRNG